MNAGDVVRRQGFLLQFVVLYRGSSRGQELRHGVGQVRRAVRARIMLDHRHLRALAGDDHVARMDGRIGSSRDEEEVDRLFDSRVTGHIDVDAVSHERGVQGAEYRLLALIGQRRLKRIGRALECVRETLERHACGQAIDV